MNQGENVWSTKKEGKLVRWNYGENKKFIVSIISLSCLIESTWEKPQGKQIFYSVKPAFLTLGQSALHKVSRCSRKVIQTSQPRPAAKHLFIARTLTKFSWPFCSLDQQSLSWDQLPASKISLDYFLIHPQPSSPLWREDCDYLRGRSEPLWEESCDWNTMVDSNKPDRQGNWGERIALGVKQGLDFTALATGDTLRLSG